MKTLILSLTILCYSLTTNGQVHWFTNISIPDSSTHSTGSIASFINKKYNSDLEKFQAAYAWVISNIRYDTDSSNQVNLGEDQNARITVALRRRRGVCENFAAILNDVTNKLGIRSFVVQGYTRQSGFIDKTGHSWVAVYINNEWLLCDPTWDAGLGIASKYFLVHPSEFLETHMPFDPLWQLQDYPVTHDAFYSGFRYDKNAPYFNYKDSIAAYIKTDSLSKFNGVASRIEKAGVENNLIKDNLSYNKMQIEMIRQEKDVALYNDAVEDLNQVSSILNDFINYRNKQFLPERSDVEMKGLLNGIESALLLCNKKLNQIDHSAATFKIGTEPVRERLNKLRKRYDEQNNFLVHYLERAKSERMSLFYK